MTQHRAGMQDLSLADLLFLLRSSTFIILFNGLTGNIMQIVADFIRI